MRPVHSTSPRSTLISATLLAATFFTALSCKISTGDKSTTESVATDASAPSQVVTSVFAVCSDAGYEGKHQFEIERDSIGNGATLVSTPNAIAGEEPSHTSIRGTYDSSDDVKSYQHLFTFGELKFIVTMEPTKLGFYPGTLAGKQADGKAVQINVLCSMQ